MTTLRFRVFGQAMSVAREQVEWVLYRESHTGIKARIYDVVIPSELKQDDLARYLDDIYHEMASDKHPSVETL